MSGGQLTMLQHGLRLPLLDLSDEPLFACPCVIGVSLLYVLGELGIIPDIRQQECRLLWGRSDAQTYFWDLAVARPNSNVRR